MKKLTPLFLIVVVAFQLNAQEQTSLTGKELFGAITARQIGPALMSGRITDLEAHPSNNRIIYTGTAGGGVWKSNDGGATFSSIFDGYAQSIGVVAVDPTNPDNVIWVGTGETWTRNSTSAGDGLYKSEDGGTTWKKMGFDNTERIASIEINPNNSNELYVGVLGALWGDSQERGVYKTTDGGKTWNKIFYINEKTGCSDLVMDPSDPNTLYAAFWEFRRTAWSFNSGGIYSALYKSTDGGKTWAKIHNGFPAGKLGRIAVAIAPSNSQVVYAVLETEQDKDKGLYRSDDGGNSWKHLNGDFGLVVRPFYFSRIVIDPKNPDVVVKGGLTGSISRDGGKTFKNLGNMHSDIHDILFDIHQSDRLYCGTDGGVYRSWNGGTTMEIVANLPVSQFYQVSVDNEEPYNVYGGLQDNGSWWGPSSSPGGVEARDWNPVGYGDGFRVLRHPGKKIIYSEMQGAENVWRYDIEKNQAKTIQPLPVKGDPKLRFNWNTPMAISENKPDRFYMGSQFLHVSDDMGDTWRKISPDLTTNNPAKLNQVNSGGLSRDNSGAENHCTIFTIAESPLDETVIWVGTDDGNVQVTRDGGKTWANTVAAIPGLPANTWCYHIEASVHNKATAYAVFDGHTRNDKKPYIYKTTDYGATWTSLVTDQVQEFARNIQEDYVNENLLFLGTEGGLYITIDGGKNWNKFTNNMPAAAVHYIELHKKTNDLVLATHGRGIIIIDDISPLRQITPSLLQKNVHFFDVKPTIMKEESGFGGASTELQFVGPNPPNAARIVYYLKNRHTFGKMTLEVFNQAGEKVADLAPGKLRGINIVNWNYSLKMPKVAIGKTVTYGALTAPRVLPATYTLVLTKGKETYRHPLVLQTDPSSLLSSQERTSQHQTIMKLYTMTQELAYLVYQLDEMVAAAEKRMKEDTKAKKSATEFIKAANSLKETLVITTGDNYVGSAEPQLREKLADLYSKVASSYTLPTSAELENLQLIEERFATAKTSFDKIKTTRWTKVERYLEKPLTLQPYEEFIAN